MRRILTLLLLTGLLIPAMAQKISVEGFKKVKKDLLNQTPLPVDKTQATMDFLTDEKGFTFKADGKVNLNEIIEAVRSEDTLAIETVEKIGTSLGKGLAGLINIFNPELVVIGGKLAVASGDYLMLPIRTAIRRHVLNIAFQDTSIKMTQLKQKAAPIGASLLVRSRMLGIL